MFGKPNGGDLFNNYHSWWQRVSGPTDGVLDVTTTVRVRGFGSDAMKQKAWNDEWRSKHPTWGPVSQVTVSSDVPQVWMDIRANGCGLMLPVHILGHEMGHVLKLSDNRVIDPDSYAGR
jgi:hypothetical protein